MKKDMMNIICCPICKGDLKLEITKEENNEIVQGNLSCNKCNHIYKIEDRIPCLL